VEEPLLLFAVDRIVRGIEIEDDLLRRRRMRLDEWIDEQPLDCRAIIADIVIALEAPAGACPSRFSVLFPAKASQSSRRASSLPIAAASTGSNRSGS
jgi:hypothetical protein